MNDAYSPDTLEHIATTTPAAWMGRAGAPAPAYDPQTSSCYWRNSAWNVVAQIIDYQKIKTDASALIDLAAGTARLKYITDVAGQSETYLSKAADATNYKAAGYPAASISSYPMIQAEGKAINGSAPTAAQYQVAADGILTQQTQWIQLAAAIEQQRRAGKLAVAATATVAAIQAAQQAAITALAAL